MTIDGFCDHTAAVAADDELHQHYTQLLSEAGELLYGRTTYQLMESYWPEVVKNPTGNESTDDFGVIIENLPKVIFSRTLKQPGWKNARIASRDLKDEVAHLKQQPGSDILVGSPSLIVQLSNLKLIDEYQLCIHPVIVGHGLPLFKSISDQILLRLIKTKTFRSGALVLYYQPGK